MNGLMGTGQTGYSDAPFVEGGYTSLPFVADAAAGKPTKQAPITEGNPLFDFLAGGAGLALIRDAYEGLEDIGERGLELGGQLASQGISQTQFRPYTISTATGGQFGAARGADGGIDSTMTLSEREQAITDALFGQSAQYFGQPTTGAQELQQAGLGAVASGQSMMGEVPFGVDMTQDAARQAFGLGSQFMTGLADPVDAREQAVYERMRAAQTPEEERQRLALEERLAAQGRLGTRTSQFGGTSEQLALAQAQEEAKNRAILSAMGQAQAEQAQQAALGVQYAGLGANLSAQQQALRASQQAQALQALQAGQGLLGGSQALTQGQQQLGMSALAGAYLPQQQLVAATAPGQTAAAQQQQAQIYGAQLFGEAQASGIDTLLATALGRANLAGALGTGLFSGALGSGFDFDFPFLP
jgi:hypothetical protein